MPLSKNLAYAIGGIMGGYSIGYLQFYATGFESGVLHGQKHEREQAGIRETLRKITEKYGS